LSAYLAGRDANRGQCAQACRWRYRLEEETRSGEFFPITEDERGTYIFNSRDLSLLAALPELFPLGLDSLKIEGRMKSLHYVATVTSVYRQAIDSYFAAPESFTVRESWLAELAKISHRPYTEGFLHGNPGAAGQIYTAASYTQTHEFVGVVREARDGFLLIEQRGAVALGDRLEILQPGGALVFCPVTAMFDTDGAPIERAPHPKELFRVPYAHALSPLSLVRRAKNGA
jgi:putative protease